ncbi:MAG: 6-carboxytetrahydropterin synthase [Bacteroidota bacterium]|nr:6-carboxytetrahydropterin synthase [Bacteroidota bacterium]MDP4214797.1 6-carboxytetrahydropterin synthase [Bacteroidota bacterium]MDP4246875.1 6-carboxytetrahydropterin synthase [Bacteroidota bacterium]MDP4252752.1 6-carboxytetrahydropterin synthase [Bacteroidota bacterium]MDP4256824.1 6-carboxytetrahydropterin synthase [Bacteroidota bacterium]
MRRVAVFRKEHFNAAHRLFNPAWDDRKNGEVFGKCAYPNYHGHNYEVIVRVIGVPDPVTGFLIDMKVLSGIIREAVLDKFDHKNLNLDTPYFRNVNPTAENIVMVIYDLLRERIDPALELQVRLYETERNFVEYPVDKE